MTRLPDIMSDVKSVEPVDGDGIRTAWTVSGPMGKSVSWEADIVEDAPPYKIAWATVDSADPDVKNSGVVRFDDKGGGRTGVEVSVEFRPPAGKLGEAVAKLTSDPQADLVEDLGRFKEMIEGGKFGRTVGQS